MSEFKHNIWAPWRMQYIGGLADEPGCFLCRYSDHPEQDAEHHVLYRDEHVLVVLNRFPYTSGHTLIAPRAHLAGLQHADDALLSILMQRIRDVQEILRTTVNAQGFNIGMNVGHCAGAGLPDHMHWHVVPRWSGDTNFMAVFDDVRVIPEGLNAVYERFRETAKQQQRLVPAD